MASPEQIEFSQSVEGLFIKGIGPSLTTDIKQKLRSAGLDLDLPLRPGYPAGDFHRWVELVAKALYPNAARDEALRLVGHRAVAGLEEGLLGKAVSAGLKIIGPKRALQRVDRIFKNNNNYQIAQLVDLTETTARVTLNEVYGLPTYYVGLFETALRIIGAKDPRVSLLASPPPGAVLQITWSL